MYPRPNHGPGAEPAFSIRCLRAAVRRAGHEWEEGRGMIDGLKPYPAMKDSGVPWLGQVPKHWKVDKIKHVAWLNPAKSEAGTSTSELATFLPMERVGSDGRIDAHEQRP